MKAALACFACHLEFPLGERVRCPQCGLPLVPVETV